ncbi:MAG: carbohydrate kinase family protein [Candidatus Heimdallarchaeota archaeon]|nr:carbohydrate kinase family protein [Candidatus Heimdallarchaeota archaeon]
MKYKQIFCLGHISVDVFIHKSDLKDLRIGGCISSTNLSILGGGVAANVAYWLGSLGTRVSMIGVISDDPSGLLLRNDLEKAGVNCILKISEKNPSASILIIVEENGERSFIINGKCLDELTIEDVPIKEIQEKNLLYTSAYNIENPPISNTVMEVLKLSKIDTSSFEVIFNLAAYTTVERFRNRIKEHILPYTDILLGNLEEYQTLVEKLDSEPLELLMALQNDYREIKIFLLTDGENGCYYLSQTDRGHVLPAEISVVDSTGAGDGFCAGFINGHTNNLPLKQAIKSGIDLGTHICKGFGARYDATNYVSNHGIQ